MAHPPTPPHPRKIEIMEAAVSCFLERGYHQTGVRDIARRAGVSLGNLYNHFRGKEAVLAFIAEVESAELDGFIAKLRDPSDPAPAMARFLTDYAAWASRPENALLGVEILAEALRNPTIADAFGRNRTRLVDALADCLARGAAKGAFAPTESPRDVACAILDALEGHGLRSLSGSGKDTSKAALHAMLLNALRP